MCAELDQIRRLGWRNSAWLRHLHVREDNIEVLLLKSRQCLAPVIDDRGLFPLMTNLRSIVAAAYGPPILMVGGRPHRGSLKALGRGATLRAQHPLLIGQVGAVREPPLLHARRAAGGLVVSTICIDLDVLRHLGEDEWIAPTDSGNRRCDGSV